MVGGRQPVVAVRRPEPISGGAPPRTETSWLILDHPELKAYLGRYDPELLTYTWTAADRKTFVVGTVRRGGEIRTASA